MFDDLRQQANQNTFEEAAQEEQDAYSFKEKPAPPKLLFGMTPVQRFVVALMLLIMTCMLSALILLVMDKVYLPF